jgi:hypothetical protein
MKKSSNRSLTLLLIALSALVIGLPVIILINTTFYPAGDTGPRAAIVDQLGSQYPNPALIDKLTEQLEQYGFGVTVFSGEQVNVDLYRRLPEYGFRLIIFRAHSDLTEDNQETGRTLLYTNEPYSKFKYVQHQLNDRIIPAHAEEDEAVNFALSSRFISEAKQGNFHHSIIIMMGCASLRLPDMAQAFIEKGALAYIGWSGIVTLNHVDDTTPVLIDNLFHSGLNIKESLARTIEGKGVDPYYESFPLYYPYESGDYILSELPEFK